MTVVVPCLSPDGWVTDTATMADRLMAHFFASDYSQTHVFPDKVASIAAILQRNQNNMTRTQSDLRDSLRNYLEPHFSSVEVEVQISDNGGTTTVCTAYFYIKVVGFDGVEFNFSSIGNIVDSKFQAVLDVNNG